MVSNKAILGFIVLNTILIAGAFYSYQSSLPDMESTLMLYREFESPVELYEIHRKGIDKIWTSEFVGIDSGVSVVEDIDGDGDLEVVNFLRDTTLYVLDLADGSEIWRINLRPISASEPELFVYDLDSDGDKEIIIKRNTNNFELVDETIQVFSHTGDLLQKITPSETNVIKGPSNIRIADFENDGNAELIVSYGHVLWQYNSPAGAYLIEKYTWDTSTTQFQLVNEVTAQDNGGNTELELLRIGGEVYIYTIGWYNNPLRLFDSELNLLWNKTLYDTDEFIQLGDARLDHYIDNQGNTHLLVSLSNYWANTTLSVLDLDPLTGQIQQRIDLDHTRTIQMARHNDYLYLYNEELVTPESEERIFKFYLYELETFEYIGEVVTPDNEEYSLPVRNFDESFELISTQPYPSVLAKLTDGRLVMTNPKTSFYLFDVDAERVDMLQVINSSVLSLDGVSISTFGNFNTGAFIGFLLLLNIVGIGGYLGKGAIFEIWDNFRLSDDWKLKTYLRMKPIFEQSFQGIPLLNSPDVHLYPLALPEFDFSDLEVPETKTTHETLDIDVSDWYEMNAERLRKLKATDFVIMVSFLENNEPMTPIDILDHVNVTAKSTIYRRINFLSDLELLENTNDIDDQRTTKYQLTTLGISFLKTFHKVLESVMN